MTRLREMRRSLNSLAVKFGFSFDEFWQDIALRQHRIKLDRNKEFRFWNENEAPKWLMMHWGHKPVGDELAQNHLASQLYELIRLLKDRMESPGEASVLDAGASDGMFLSQLGITHGVGVNILKVCAQKIKSDGFTASLSDIEKLPFANRSFDYVICCETLEHVPNPIKTLNELSRVCRKRIFMSIPWLERTRINIKPEGWPNVESHIFEFSEPDFQKIISWAKVRLVYKTLIKIIPDPSNPVFKWILQAKMYPSFFPKLQYYELEPMW